MSGETESNVSGWTVDTLAQHTRIIRDYEDRFQSERDRRYTEVGVEREKALKIKETADLAALSLAREIQTYKDEKANELREQINNERGLYATKNDLIAVVDKFETLIQPLTTFVQQAVGQATTRSTTFSQFTVIVAIGISLFTAIIIAITGHLK